MTQRPTIEFKASRPAEVTAAERAAFMQQVREGGEVDPDTLRALVDRAVALAMASNDGAMVGVGAIKRPNPTHRSHVFKAAKVDLLSEAFELGWLFVHPDMRGRGLSCGLVAALVPCIGAARVYATSRVDNAPMHATLNRFGFKSVGVPYPSRQNDTTIQLFVRA